MNNLISEISDRFSLRPPQKESLCRLAEAWRRTTPRKGADMNAALQAIHEVYATVTDFERDFPSLCFALATGVGKTRLMGAFIVYLYRAYQIRHFLVLAPNLTIYDKLIRDFTPNTPKYVFRGVQEFAIESPKIITGDNYNTQVNTLYDRAEDCVINIFNISKLNSEVRGGKSPRIKRLSEYIGESYFEYLSKLDLVLLMDEAHRYRASAGVRAINELKPIFGMELTATPFEEKPKKQEWFRNIIYTYSLGHAIRDGFVKEPAVVTRQNFNPAGVPDDEMEQIKLEDGIRLHESVKIELENYARNFKKPLVKPFVLVIARDTSHATELFSKMQEANFFEGRYKGRVLQVDSSKTGQEEDEMIKRLLQVERTDEPTEIVIHVNMLKEGWDVTNLYTIIPLRPARARTLVEQSIGRGLRLPYGNRTGIRAIDWLNIVAHDKFDEIIAECRNSDSIIQPQELKMPEPEPNAPKKEAKTVEPIYKTQLGIRNEKEQIITEITPLLTNDEEKKIAAAAVENIHHIATNPKEVPTLDAVRRENVLNTLVQRVKTQTGTVGETSPAGNDRVADVVKQAADIVIKWTIPIPRITIEPAEVRHGFRPFTLDLTNMRYSVEEEKLVLTSLMDIENETVIGVSNKGIKADRLEDYIVQGLNNFNEIPYEEHCDLLYGLAEQTVNHLRGLMNDDADAVEQVLKTKTMQIARFIYVQMKPHFYTEAVRYQHRVCRGYTELLSSSYTITKNEDVRDYRTEPEKKSQIGQYLYGGFKKCLYEFTKFQSDDERRMSMLLERDAERWFRPAREQFQIYYYDGPNQREYQPDFVAETTKMIHMIELKPIGEHQNSDVRAKAEAARKWCEQASLYAKANGGKPWRYALIDTTDVQRNMTLLSLMGE